MKKKLLLAVLVIILNRQDMFALGYEAGILYGVGISTIGQDPFVERYGERYTFMNFMISNELVLNSLFRLEMDIIFDERGFVQRRGDETKHSLYYFELPLLATVSPFPFLYLGAGFGFACRIATAEYDSNPYAEAIQGYDNFVDAKTARYECNFVLTLGFRYRLTERFTAAVELRHVYGLTDANAHELNSQYYGDDNKIFERFRSLYLYFGLRYRVL